MPQVRDPVCGMTIDSQTATARSSYAGEEFYFCSVECKREFDENPARYRNNTALADQPNRGEEENPRFTKQGNIVSPKFGAAGSGGAEFEPLPPGTRD